LGELHDYSALKNELFPALGGRYYVRKPFENIDLLDNITEIADMNSLEAKLSMADVNK
jgi:hypothetical protein